MSVLAFFGGESRGTDRSGCEAVHYHGWGTDLLGLDRTPPTFGTETTGTYCGFARLITSIVQPKACGGISRPATCRTFLFLTGSPFHESRATTNSSSTIQSKAAKEERSVEASKGSATVLFGTAFDVVAVKSGKTLHAVLRAFLEIANLHLWKALATKNQRSAKSRSWPRRTSPG